MIGGDYQPPKGSPIKQINGIYKSWTRTTTDVRALELPTTGATARLAARWYGSQFTVDVKLAAGQTRKVSLYVLDWDKRTARSGST